MARLNTGYEKLCRILGRIYQHNTVKVAFYIAGLALILASVITVAIIISDIIFFLFTTLST